MLRRVCGMSHGRCVAGPRGRIGVRLCVRVMRRQPVMRRSCATWARPYGDPSGVNGGVSGSGEEVPVLSPAGEDMLQQWMQQRQSSLPPHRVRSWARGLGAGVWAALEDVPDVARRMRALDDMWADQRAVDEAGGGSQGDVAEAVVSVAAADVRDDSTRIVNDDARADVTPLTDDHDAWVEREVLESGAGRGRRNEDDAYDGRKRDGVEQVDDATVAEAWNNVMDLQAPEQLPDYAVARSMDRTWHLHIGPTNSSKTHTALQSLVRAESGIYCGPLRLLAGEIHTRLNTEYNVPCNLVTGQQRIHVEGAKHTSCTIEMAPLDAPVLDVAVIDEVQLLADVDRGWAWTRALLGIPARQVHICGSPSALELVQHIGASCARVTVLPANHLKRLSPLHLDTPLKRKQSRKRRSHQQERARRDRTGAFVTPLKHQTDDWVHQLQMGDAVIAFSRKRLHRLREVIERETSHKCCVVYGSLPPETRQSQADLFNSGETSGYSVLLATDAVGMGLNLRIRRIIFDALSKFDGEDVRPLTPAEVQQIAGRAGRYGGDFASEGYVTCVNAEEFEALRFAMKSPQATVTMAGLAPSYAQLSAFADAWRLTAKSPHLWMDNEQLRCMFMPSKKARRQWKQREHQQKADAISGDGNGKGDNSAIGSAPNREARGSSQLDHGDEVDGDDTMSFLKQLSALSEQLDRPPTASRGDFLSDVVSSSGEEVEDVNQTDENGVVCTPPFSVLLQKYLELVSTTPSYFLCTHDDALILATLLDDVPLSLFDRYTFTLTPAKTSNPLCLSYVRAWARRYAGGANRVGIGLRIERRAAVMPPMSRLRYLEEVYDVIDAYLWLSTRMEPFHQHELALQLRDEVTTLFETTLSDMSDVQQKQYLRNTRQKRNRTDKRAAAKRMRRLRADWR